MFVSKREREGEIVFFVLIRLFVGSGVSHHHQHRDHHPVGADSHGRDPRGSGQSRPGGPVGEKRLERAEILVPGGGRRQGHGLAGPAHPKGGDVAGIWALVRLCRKRCQCLSLFTCSAVVSLEQVVARKASVVSPTVHRPCRSASSRSA